MESVQIWSFFWSVVSCIRTEYGDLLRKSPQSVLIQKNTDQKKLLIDFFSHILPIVLLQIQGGVKLLNRLFHHDFMVGLHIFIVRRPFLILLYSIQYTLDHQQMITIYKDSVL